MLCKGHAKVFCGHVMVLREIGVELTRYHGGSLNGKDIKTFTDNATYVFD